MKFKMQKERSLYIALLVALLAMLALGGAYAQGAGVQDLKALRVENWINVGTDLSVGGNSSITGNETVGGTLGVTGVLSAAGFANSNYLSVAAPTAIASATPAVRINNLGAGNDALSVEKASTPVFKIGNSGAVTAQSLTLSTPLAAGQFVAPTPQPTATPEIRYKVYRALLTQSGTNAPVATVLENTLGGTVVWTRNQTGQHLGTLAGAFTAGKTFVSCHSNMIDEGGVLVLCTRYSGDTVSVNVYVNDQSSDDYLIDMPIEVLVYP